MVITIFVYIAIWKCLYTADRIPEDINFQMIVTHFVITLGLSGIFIGSADSVSDKIVKGTIATDILKPLSFLGMTFAQETGKAGVTVLIQFLPALAITCLFTGVQAPVNVLCGILFLASMILSYTIYFALNYIVAILAFWVQKTFFLVQIKFAFISIFSGVFFPIWFLPEFMQKIVVWTPFESIYSIPLSHYFGRYSTALTISAFFRQMIWCILLLAAGHFLFKIAVRRLTIQGG
jgi:ABC-2 type transport system permease protein